MKRPVTFAMFFLTLATAACVPAPETGPVQTTESPVSSQGVKAVRIADYRLADVGKFCDAGRAVYVAQTSSSGATALAVVENAPECAQ